MRISRFAAALRVLARAGTILSVAATAFGGVRAQDAGDEDLRTGALPLSRSAFAALPKTPVYRAYLPDRVDLSDRFPVPGDQGKQGSCTAWAVGYAARSYYVGSTEGRDVHDAANVASPAYIYGSIVDDPRDCNGGSSIRSALDVLKSRGALSLRAYPYRPGSCQRPTDIQQARAEDFRIADWRAVDFENLDQVKAELAKNNPVIVALRATPGFKRLRRGQVYSETGPSTANWHAISVVAYDERRQAFRFINSWGPRWAEDGFGWISYPAFLAQVGEAYVMRPARPMDPERPRIVISRPVPRPDVPVPPGPRPAPTPEPPTPARVDACSDVGAARGGEGAGPSGVAADLTGVREGEAAAKPADAAADLAARPWPQCEVLETLSGPLSRVDRPTVRIEQRRDGPFLSFHLTTPPFPSFIHLAYLQADGTVVNLVQPDAGNLRSYPPSTTIDLGAAVGTGPQFRISAPFGNEMLVVVASRSPLFDAPRPVTETDREFLTGLRKALLTRPDAAFAERSVTANMDTVTTSEPAPNGGHQR